MKTRCIFPNRRSVALLTYTAVALALACGLRAGVIVNVVETGGDNEATDTVPAKWTGVTYVGGIANEPVPGLPAGASYTVLTFSNHSPTFVDRNHRYTNASATATIPSYLLGADYIMSGNDNRDNAGYRLDVTVSSRVAVYMLIDNRLGDPNSSNADPPSFGPTRMQWILDEAWQPTTNGINRTANPAVPDEIGLDESADGSINQWYSVYTKVFEAGTFQLKQPDNAGQNMYGVVIVSIGPSTPPAAPSPVSAVSGNQEVILNWSSVQGASGYNIKRASVSGGPYTTIASGATTTFTDSPLANATDYFYVISATNILGESTNSVEVVGRPNPFVTDIIAEGGSNTVTLSWTALAGATSYSVLRSTSSNGTFAVVASNLVATSYVDTNPPPGTTLYYRVSASLGAAGQSGQSEAASAFTAPGAPVVSASVFATTVIRVSWTSDPVVTGFLLERSTDGVNFSPLAELAANEKSFTNSGLALNTTYFYRVRATNIVGLSPYSTVASNTTPAFGWNVNFGSGGNASAGALNSPTPVGYLNDIGDLFGDRTNGYFYGWSTPGGTNITRDTRWRQNAGSPDLRYDTFVHLMKASVNDPAQSAIWEIEVPNGFYRVHIVAGDPDNADPNADRFQFNVEGALTPAHTPTLNPFSNRFADFTVSVGVSDGRLSISSGPLARNNKIAFVDIYPDVPVAPVITGPPQNTTIEQNRPVALSATVTGSAVLQYQWYFNDVAVPNATNAALAFARPQPANSGSYYVIVTNYGGSATSTPVTLTVTPDTAGPEIVSVGSLDGRYIGVAFNEEIDVTSGAAQEFGNYSVNGGAVTVIALTFRPDGKSVSLLVDQTITGAFTVEVLDVPDYAGNLTADSESGQVLGFTAQDVGGPAFPGRNFTADNQTIEVVGGGADIWGTADQGYLATKPYSGDFDARVRVIDLQGSNNITKAVLTARESTSADSAAITISVNPTNRRNQIEAAIRPTTGAATVAVGNSFIPAAIPNAWMRISRVGNLFTAYRSTNGFDWIPMGQTNIALATDMQIGFGITAHDNTLLATGTFSGFQVSQSFPDLALTGNGTPNPVTAGNSVTYSFAVTNSGVGEANDVRLRDVLPAGLTFVSATASQGACANVGGTVTCDLGTITNAGQATVTIVATATTSGSKTNSATVTAFPIDLNSANNAATVVLTVNQGTSQSPIVNFGFTGGIFGGAIQTQSGTTYTVQYKNDLNAVSWSTLTTIIGDGTVKTFTDPGPAVPQRFYRIVTP